MALLNAGENLQQIRAGADGWKSHFPSLPEPFASTGIIETSLPRKEFVSSTHVNGALFIHLLGHGRDTGSWLSQLAGDPCQVNELEDILVSVGTANDTFRA